MRTVLVRSGVHIPLTRGNRHEEYTTLGYAGVENPQQSIRRFCNLIYRSKTKGVYSGWRTLAIQERPARAVRADNRDRIACRASRKNALVVRRRLN